MRSKKVLLSAFKVVISVALIAFLLHRIGINVLAKTLSNANITYITLAFALIVSGVVISSYKWHILLSVHDIKMDLSTLVSLYFISMFWRNFLSTVGGEAYKIYGVSKQTGKLIESFASVVLERGTGLLALLSISFVSVLFGHGFGLDKTVILLVIILFVGYLLIVGTLFNRNWSMRIIKIFAFFKSDALLAKITKVHNSIFMYRGHKALLIRAVIISFIYQTTAVVMAVFIISRSLNLQIPLIYFFLFCPIIGIFEMLPISLNGIGVREGAFLFFFTKVGVLEVQAFSMSFVMYAVVLIVSLIGGVVYAVKR